MRLPMRWSRSCLAALLILTLVAWKPADRLDALPPSVANEATISGMAGVRYAVNQTSGVAMFLRDLEHSLRIMNRDQPGASISYLSISGVAAVAPLAPAC